MAGPCSASGRASASAAASSSSRPTPMCFARFQTVADIRSRCSVRPGVPASTSRKGAAAAVDWPALSNARPTATSSVCASSSRTTSGRWVQRSVNRAVSVPGSPPSSQPSRPMPIETDNLSGSSDRKRSGGARAVASASRAGRSLGVRQTTSILPSASISPCSHRSNTVFPLPRGPDTTASLGAPRPAWT